MAASLGARIVASDVDADSAGATVDEIVAAGGAALVAPADVTDREQVRAVARLAVDRYGALDVMVNNAGVMPLAFFADHAAAADAWDRCIDINLKGVLHGIMAVYDQMIEQGRGHIVNISSIYGNQATAGSGVYSATKAAVRILSDALRAEAQGRIKVTVVRPTGVGGTGLAAGIVNPDALIGATGQHRDRFDERVQRATTGSLRPEEVDVDDVRYWAIRPEDLVREVLHAINQPWGVTISDVTVRATGEDYVI
jgi:NADP-dependent 3-hydroxy acid dehydrogenase YdfG